MLSKAIDIKNTVFFTLSSYRKQEFYERLEDKAITTAELPFDADGVDPHVLKLFDYKNITTLDEEESTVYDSLNRMVYDSGNDHFHVSAQTFQQIRQKQRVRLHQGEHEMVGVGFTFNNHLYVVVACAVDRYGKGKLPGTRALYWVAAEYRSSRCTGVAFFRQGPGSNRRCD